MVLRTVQQSFLIAGDVTTFDRVDFRARLATSLSVDPSSISLSVSAASVRVNASIVATTATEQTTLHARMRTFSEDPVLATSLLQVTVESASAPVGEIAFVTAPSMPPLPPPPSPSSPPPLSPAPTLPPASTPPQPPSSPAMAPGIADSIADNLEAVTSVIGLGGLIGIGAGVLSCAILSCVCCCFGYRLYVRRRRGPGMGAPTYNSSAVHECESSSSADGRARQESLYAAMASYNRGADLMSSGAPREAPNPYWGGHRGRAASSAVSHAPPPPAEFRGRSGTSAGHTPMPPMSDVGRSGTVDAMSDWIRAARSPPQSEAGSVAPWRQPQPAQPPGSDPINRFRENRPSITDPAFKRQSFGRI